MISDTVPFSSRRRRRSIGLAVAFVTCVVPFGTARADSDGIQGVRAALASGRWMVFVPDDHRVLVFDRDSDKLVVYGFRGDGSLALLDKRDVGDDIVKPAEDEAGASESVRSDAPGGDPPGFPRPAHWVRTRTSFRTSVEGSRVFQSWGATYTTDRPIAEVFEAIRSAFAADGIALESWRVDTASGQGSLEGRRGEERWEVRLRVTRTAAGLARSTAIDVHLSRPEP